MLVGARDLLPMLLHAGYEVVLFGSVYEAVEFPTRCVDGAIVDADLEMSGGLVFALRTRTDGQSIVPLLVFRGTMKAALLGQHLGVARAQHGFVRDDELFDRLWLAIKMTKTTRDLERSLSMSESPLLAIQDARTVRVEGLPGNVVRDALLQPVPREEKPRSDAGAKHSTPPTRPPAAAMHGTWLARASAALRPGRRRIQRPPHIVTSPDQRPARSSTGAWDNTPTVIDKVRKRHGSNE